MLLRLEFNVCFSLVLVLFAISFNNDDAVTWHRFTLMAKQVRKPVRLSCDVAASEILTER